MNFFTGVDGFDWDNGNRDKNWLKHGVSRDECEEVFFDPHKRVKKIAAEFQEDRYILVGHTLEKRDLYIVFTFRKNKVRVISARDLNRRERHLLD